MGFWAYEREWADEYNIDGLGVALPKDLSRLEKAEKNRQSLSIMALVAVSLASLYFYPADGSALEQLHDGQYTTFLGFAFPIGALALLLLNSSMRRLSRIDRQRKLDSIRNGPPANDDKRKRDEDDEDDDEKPRRGRRAA